MNVATLITMYATATASAVGDISATDMGPARYTLQPRASRWMLSGMSEDTAGEAKTLTCPKCRNVMKPVTFEEITVDRCVSCGGLWFDVMEQRRLKDRPGSEVIDTAPAEQKNAVHPPAGKMICPCCNAPLTRLHDVDNRTIEYEYCAVCNGAFFDGGEFRQYKDTSFLGSFRHLFGGRSSR
jgi:uncharacterized protein